MNKKFAKYIGALTLAMGLTMGSFVAFADDICCCHSHKNSDWSTERAEPWA